MLTYVHGKNYDITYVVFHGMSDAGVVDCKLSHFI